MSTGNHKVQRILFEIINTEQGSYQADEEALSAIVNESFTRALEELLDEANGSDDTIRIEQLTLDLGVITRPFDTASITAAFKDQLRKQLSNEIGNNTKKTSGKDREKKEGGSEAEALIWFLRNGVLPWWSSALPSVGKWQETAFRKILTHYLFSNGSRAVQKRLLQQFTDRELRTILQHLVAEKGRAVFTKIAGIMDPLIQSADLDRQVSGKQLIRKTLAQLIEGQGIINSYEDLLTAFIAEDSTLQKLSLEETAVYLGDLSVLNSDAVKEIKEEQSFANDLTGKEQAEVKTVLLQKEQSVLHYLAFGSLPVSGKAQTMAGSESIPEQELFVLIRELLLRSPAKLAALLKGHRTRQHTFVNILLGLPASYFKNILSIFLRKTDFGGDEQLKKQIRDALSVAIMPGEIKTPAAVLLMKQLLKERITSAEELHAQSKLFLKEEERKKLAAVLSVEEPAPAGTKEAESDPPGADVLDAVYFSNLLTFVLNYAAWPWWGNRYTDLHGEADLENDPDATIEKILRLFKRTYGAAYADFAKELIRETEKPSALFSGLNWTNALSILDEVLPVFRNTFSETLEAVIALISQHKALGLHPKIAAQQLLLFIIDQQRGQSFNFKEGINELITLIAVKFKLPLWETYGILVKHYDTLSLKTPLTKEEAVNLFQYHESLEEQYVKIAEMAVRRNDETSYSKEQERIPDVNFIGEKHEALILEYISGRDMVLKAFPSAWALGTFIRERLKSPAVLFSILRNSLLSGNFRSVYRLVQLESLSKQTWLNLVLDNKEQQPLQSDLYELLGKISTANRNNVKQFIRSAFITEQYWEGEAFSPERFKAVLQTLSAGSGIALAHLELEIVKSLSAGTVNENSLHRLFDVPDFDEVTSIQQPEQKNFLSNLKELSYRKQANVLKEVLEGIQDPVQLKQLLVEVKAIRSRTGLVSWVNEEINPDSYREEKTSLLEFIASLQEQAALSSFFAILQNTLDTIPAPEEQLSKQTDQRLLSVIHFVELSEYSKGKRNLLRFLETGAASDPQKLIVYVRGLQEFPEKGSVLEFIDKEFSVDNTISRKIPESENDNTEKQRTARDEKPEGKEPAAENEIDNESSVFTRQELNTLIRLIDSFGNFSGKEKLQAFINKNAAVKKETLLSFITELHFPEKQQLLSAINEQFFGTEITGTTKNKPRHIDELLLLLENKPAFRAKQEILNFIDNNTIATKDSFISFIQGLDVEYKQEIFDLIGRGFPETANENLSLQIAAAKANKAPHVQALLSVLENTADFPGKRTLLNFINIRYAADQRTFISFVNSLQDFPDKAKMIELFRRDFPVWGAQVSPESNEAIVKEKSFQWWKETLGFDSSLPVTKELQQKPGSLNIPADKENPGDVLQKSRKDAQEKAKTKGSESKPDKLKQRSSKEEASAEIQTAAKTIDLPEPLSEEEIIEELKAANTLSHDSIADIALYYFFNGELPWWSSVKETDAFEKMLQSTALSATFILARKLNAAADYQPEFFKELAVLLVSAEAENKTALAPEQIIETLEQNNTWLKELYLQNPGSEYPAGYVHELIRQYEKSISNDISTEELQLRFVRTLGLLLTSIDPSIAEVIQNDGDLPVPENEQNQSISGTWQQVMKAIRKEKEVKNQKFYPLRAALKQIEQSLNGAGIARGLAVTDRLFFLPDQNTETTNEEILGTWLFMLEKATGTEIEKLQAIIADTKEQLTAESIVDATFIESIASLRITQDEWRLPYTNIVTALALVLDETNLLSADQRYIALQLFTDLVQSKGANDSIDIPYTVFFNYLSAQGLSKEEFIRLCELTKSRIGDTNLQRSVENALQAVAGKDPGADYLRDADVEKEKTEHSGLSKKAKVFGSVEEAVELIIKKLRERQPVLTVLESKYKEEQDVRRAKNKPEQADTPKERIDIDLNDNIYIPNAGLIILWPFLTRLFTNLKYIEKGAFIDPEKQQRAIHLTQYMVGFSEDHPEYTLMLNKLICGVELTEPAERTVSLTEEEKSEAGNLINAVLAQWKEMNNTSPENFQRTFIQREGLMYQKDGNWYIKVTRTAFDVLLLKLPWGLSIIKYPWNNYLIFVEWKAMN
ncbi:MAG: hypothetical protein K0S33_1749 [Bacteroidetes bacterium]|jgi:hypothetical protein|nr:hypothetical protein [Bacteroidota bacterium]